MQNVLSDNANTGRPDGVRYQSVHEGTVVHGAAARYGRGSQCLHPRTFGDNVVPLE